MGCSPVGALPQVGSGSGMVTSGVSCGAGQAEAPTSTSFSAAKCVGSSVRKGKGKALSGSPAKTKRSRKSKGRPQLRVLDDETDDDDCREDDRIMELLRLGVDLATVDRLYCCDGLSAGDVERLVGSSTFLLL